MSCMPLPGTTGAGTCGRCWEGSVRSPPSRSSASACPPLSATPRSCCAGSRQDEAGAVVGEPAPSGDADVTIDYVGTLANAATVISRLHRGAKRLVFCDSRSRVEELAAALRELEVRTFVSHSSLSLSERRQAEQAFGEDSNCVIVATSTLELGIDVGDLDYVIQIDAPSDRLLLSSSAWAAAGGAAAPGAIACSWRPRRSLF